MILLGENTDGLIASELLKPSREQITVFCGVPRKEMATLFQKTEQVAAFQDFSKSTYLKPYCRKNYEIERKVILEGYREVIHGILGTEGNRDPVLHFSEMLTDDALAYYVARDRGCAYAPMNGASINLGPQGRLFENSLEHQQAVRSGVPCFAGFTLFQFSRKPVESEVIDSQRLKPSHGLEETEVGLCGNMLIIRSPSEDAHAACFSRHSVTGPHSYV